MSDGVQDASYFCALCGENRYVEVNMERHRERIRNSPSGLVDISDIHYCHQGVLSINNLHVDHNLHVRSFSLMELPDKKRRVNPGLGIPMPSQQSELNTYKITRMLPEGGYRIRLIDKALRVNLNIGEIAKNEEAEEVISSDKGNVVLYYYPSDVKLRKQNREWFEELVEAIESLPPTRLGLFLEALRYVHDHNDESPGYFELEQLKTLLTSHKTTFEIIPHNYKAIRNVEQKYGKDKREIIDKLIDAINENKGVSLQDLQHLLQEDLVYLIFLCIILETEGILQIKRDMD